MKHVYLVCYKKDKESLEFNLLAVKSTETKAKKLVEQMGKFHELYYYYFKEPVE